MTSHQNSSVIESGHSTRATVESLASAFHPHAIEVQDFSHYTWIVDLRAQAEYDEDHIPGALRMDAPDSSDGSIEAAWTGQSLGALGTKAPASLQRNRLLLYCGDSGRTSRRAAEALRRQGVTVDVLPGGWINYRRWVQAGLEILPRLVTFRVVRSSVDGDASAVLRELQTAGRQVLDVGRLAESPTNFPGSSRRQAPSQAWFESQLLRELRGFDPGKVVWTAETDLRGGGLTMPGALGDALAIAPVADIAVEALLPGRETGPMVDAGRTPRRLLLAPLRTASLQPKVLREAVRAWLFAVEARPQIH